MVATIRERWTSDPGRSRRAAGLSCRRLPPPGREQDGTWIHTPTHSRREFIATTTAAAAAFTIVPRHVLGGPRFVAPSDKVNVALIGAGGQGRTNARALFQEDDCQIIALADPAEEWDLSHVVLRRQVGPRAGEGGGREALLRQDAQPQVRDYEDFRVMLEKEKAIDAVLIATPDHLHAYVSIIAMKAGKHVYCEKPLTHNIREARLVARVAKETGVATQMGNQGRSSEGHRQTVEWIKDGAIGAVREVHAWSGNPRTASARGRAPGPAVKPAGLNWDLWLGPARRTARTAGLHARSSGDGCGTSATAPCPTWAHHFDPGVQRARPRRADHHGGHEPRSSIPSATSGSHLVTYQYGATGNRGPLTLYWYDNGLRPPTPLGIDPDDPQQRLGEGDNGLMIVGEKGILTCAGWSGMPRLLPLELHRDYKRPPKTLPRVAGHHADWLQACKGGTPACSNFEYGARLTEFILLGTLALRTGKVVKWDAAGHEGHQRAGGAAVHRGELPQGVGAAGLACQPAGRRARSYCTVTVPIIPDGACSDTGNCRPPETWP